jgi:2-aminoadipate transaminase
VTTAINKIIAVSFVCGLANPNLFPHADLAAASEVATALNYGSAAPLYEQTISRLQAQGIASDRILMKANILQTKF